MIDQAIILAAGLGQRMRPLTNDIPKPMVKVLGKPIIDYALEMLQARGIKHIVVNTHYKAEVLEKHLDGKAIISHEPVLLDTGGGIKQALTYLDASKPVFILSGDSILFGGLDELESAWNNDTDILLSLQPLTSMKLTPAVGDYTIRNGKPVRTPDHSGEYMWNSARIIHPRIFTNTPAGPFSFLPMMDEAQKNGRLGAVIHNGIWHHLTTPADVESVNKGWHP
ncbi:MAG: nucleotidyltransferase family protein [Alphaproteobacteria bacterium]|nr:nucleotidyltransferase family protein [Alphaproteobacteria bacterium]